MNFYGKVVVIKIIFVVGVIIEIDVCIFSIIVVRILIVVGILVAGIIVDIVVGIVVDIVVGIVIHSFDVSLKKGNCGGHSYSYLKQIFLLFSG